jgi:hypothetical protein
MFSVRSRSFQRVGEPQTAPARLEVNVIYTGIRRTLAALRRAVQLAANLDAHIRIVAAVIVPHPLPLERPPVGREYTERRFRAMAGKTGVETRVQICYCRDQKNAFDCSFAAQSLVVIGGTRRWWWPTTAERTAKVLERSGHHVVFVEARENA